MNTLDNIVLSINEYFKTKVFTDDVFHSANYVGLTESVPYAIGDDFAIVPAKINNNGDAEIIFYDDKYPMQIYHKVNLKNINLSKSQYGDTNINQTDDYSLSLIVIGNRTKIKHSQFTIENLISKNFPDLNEKFIITPINVDYNSQRIFNNEFKNIEFNDTYNYFFIQIEYKIKTPTYRRKCMGCGCPPNTNK